MSHRAEFLDEMFNRGIIDLFRNFSEFSHRDGGCEHFIYLGEQLSSRVELDTFIDIFERFYFIYILG
jgi:hypothetical protein